MTDPAAKTRRTERGAPSGEDRYGPAESVESLLLASGVMRYLEARVHGALLPWFSSLSRDELAWVRARLFVELTMDPVLRGLVAKVARALTQKRERAGPSRPPEDGSTLE